MGSELELGEIIDQIETPEQFFEYYFNKIDLDEIKDRDDFLLLIQKILWNEIEELPLNNPSSIVLAAIGLYHLGELDIVDIKVLLDSYQSGNHLSDLEYVLSCYLILIKTETLNDDPVEFFKLHMKEFGVSTFPLDTTLTLAESLGEVDDRYYSISSKVKSLKSRPEYSDEILDNTDIDDLKELQFWCDPEFRNNIIERIIADKLSKTSATTYQDQLERFEDDDYLNQFPVSHKVMGDQIATFEPRSIDMDELSDVPQDLSRDWLPHFVYSKPELEENIRIYFPGGPHIGHSAIVVRSNFGSFMMDFGLSVVNTSKSRWLPLMEKLDFILISHAHMDHSGSMPLLYGNDRKLPWFGSRETKVMTEMLWSDTRKIVSRSVDPAVIEKSPNLQKLLSKGALINTLKNFNPLELDRSYKLSPSMKIKAHNAAHLFGSVGFEITLGGKRLLYTGDFNADKGAEFPTDADITLFDSTYFERYQDYPKPKEGLQYALDHSNRILIPAFSMGRSQEMLFKLRELEAEKDWNIYLTGMGGRLASKLHLNVGSTRGRSKGGVQIVPTVDPEDFGENTIVIGGQGMLQAGTSRRLFDHSKVDADTSVILCGYQAPNTLGYHLLNNNEYLLGKYKQQVRRVKLSGHTTGETLDKFMDDLSGRKVMVHAPVGVYQNRERDDVEQPSKTGPLEL